MKIYNAEKTQILGDSNTLNGIDLTLGKLVADKLFIKTHEATEAVAAVSAEENAQKRKEAGATVKEYGGKFYEVLATFENGGEEVKEILPTEGVEEKPAWDEYEDIQVYIPYTAEELEAIEINKLRAQRETECFPVINRGKLWYDRLTPEQEQELDAWYNAWLSVTETKVAPVAPSWINEKLNEEGII